jgi:hypothetical protein
MQEEEEVGTTASRGVDEDNCSVQDGGGGTNGDFNMLPTQCDSVRIEDDNFAIEASYEINEMLSESDSKYPKKLRWWKEAISLYVHFLGAHALLTKCVTSGVIGGMGDMCAQCFEHGVANTQSFARRSLDRRRVFGIFIESMFMAGPLMHYAYDFLEYLVPVHDSAEDDEKNLVKISNEKRWAAAFFHVLSDIFLLGPIYVLSMIVTTSLVEGRIGTLKKELLLDYFPTLRASIYASLAFLPMQVLAFRTLPIQFRLLYVNVQDIGWNAIVSFMAHKSRQ